MYLKLYIYNISSISNTYIINQWGYLYTGLWEQFCLMPAIVLHYNPAVFMTKLF